MTIPGVFIGGVEFNRRRTSRRASGGSAGPGRKAGVSRRRLWLLLVPVIGLAFVVVAVPRFVDSFRGASTQVEVVDRYIDSARRGDVAGILWLMPRDREVPAEASKRVAKYRDLTGRLDAEYIPHGSASYVMRVRLSQAGVLVDELVLVQIGGPVVPGRAATRGRVAQSGRRSYLVQIDAAVTRARECQRSA